MAEVPATRSVKCTACLASDAMETAQGKRDADVAGGGPYGEGGGGGGRLHSGVVWLAVRRQKHGDGDVDEAGLGRPDGDVKAATGAVGAALRGRRMRGGFGEGKEEN